MTLHEATVFLGPSRRMFGRLGSVAWLAQDLNVADVAGPAMPNRHNVVNLVFGFDAYLANWRTGFSATSAWY